MLNRKREGACSGCHVSHQSPVTTREMTHDTASMNSNDSVERWYHNEIAAAAAAAEILLFSVRLNNHKSDLREARSNCAYC